MSARVFLLALLAGAYAPATYAQSTSDGPNGRTGAGASLGFAAIRPLADPSQACRHGTDGLPGLPVRRNDATSCPGGASQPTAAEQPPGPPFTGGVFGPAGRGPDKRPPS